MPLNIETVMLMLNAMAPKIYISNAEIMIAMVGGCQSNITSILQLENCSGTKLLDVSIGKMHDVTTWLILNGLSLTKWYMFKGRMDLSVESLYNGY